jgi:hypothetical protein
MLMDLMKMFFTLLFGSLSLTAQGKVPVIKPITEKYMCPIIDENKTMQVVDHSY